jgi:enoyl-CoA hydratase/carnithine racemase
MSELVSVQDDGRVRHIVLDRADKRNAINAELMSQLRDAVREAADDPEVHCVVLRGEGPCFSAGVDLYEIGGLADQSQMLRPFRRACLEGANLLEEMAKPAIAQVHGACLGLGAELALACDMRVMANDASFGLPEVRLGLIPDVGGTTRLPAVAGLGVAKELVMTGRTIDGVECHRIGVANRICSTEAVASEAEALVEELLAAAPLAVGYSKGVLNGIARPTVTASLELEGSIQQTLVATEDFREAGAAFIEKRDPSWTGTPPASRETSKA